MAATDDERAGEQNNQKKSIENQKQNDANIYRTYDIIIIISKFVMEDILCVFLCVAWWMDSDKKKLLSIIYVCVYRAAVKWSNKNISRERDREREKRLM